VKEEAWTPTSSSLSGGSFPIHQPGLEGRPIETPKRTYALCGYSPTLGHNPKSLRMAVKQGCGLNESKHV
jgi:hypothetical protein